MIQGAINEILVAEEKATDIIKEANEKASAITLSSAVKTEELKKQASEREKAKILLKKEQAEKEGLKQADALKKEFDLEIETALKMAEKNKSAGVQFVLNRIIGESLE